MDNRIVYTDILLLNEGGGIIRVGGEGGNKREILSLHEAERAHEEAGKRELGELSRISGPLYFVKMISNMKVIDSGASR